MILMKEYIDLLLLSQSIEQNIQVLRVLMNDG